MSTNVLLLGGGGREHAIAWKLAQSPRLGSLTSAPGNAGTATYGENLADLDENDGGAVVEAAARLRADLVIVGPEAPLAAGVTDALRAEGVPVFGPSRAGAELEWSKSFAKELMHDAGIETGHAATFDDPEAAMHYVRRFGGEHVVKADGLAAGKGRHRLRHPRRGPRSDRGGDGGRARSARPARACSSSSACAARRSRRTPSPTARPSYICRSVAITSRSSTATAAPTPAAWASTRRPAGSRTPLRDASSAR